jgi:diguanylate cyclase (GGDEF)-like protein
MDGEEWGRSIGLDEQQRASLGSRMSFPATEGDRQSHELSIFHDVAKALTSSLDLDTILQTIMEKMGAYFESANWSLFMLDRASQELYCAATVGNGTESIHALRLKSGESLGQWVIKHREILVVPDVRQDARIQWSGEDEFLADGCSVVCMPISIGGTVLGVIQLAKIDMQVYARNQLLLQTLADYAAIAIQNARAVLRVQELSITDDCTGLYNARHLFTVLSEELNRSARFGYEFSLLFLDLDFFKRVNDEYGHLAGSRLLAQVGQCLRQNLRLVDAAFRYGGDEFAIVLPQTSKKAALQVVQRLIAIFHNKHWLENEGLNISLRASVGVAGYPDDGSSAQAIVQRADEMMYQVKQSGRDNIAVAGLGVVGREKPS